MTLNNYSSCLSDLIGIPREQIAPHKYFRQTASSGTAFPILSARFETSRVSVTELFRYELGKPSNRKYNPESRGEEDFSVYPDSGRTSSVPHRRTSGQLHHVYTLGMAACPYLYRVGDSLDTKITDSRSISARGLFTWTLIAS